MEEEVEEGCPHGLGERAWCVACNGKAHLTVSGEAAAIFAEQMRIVRAVRRKQDALAKVRSPLTHSSEDERAYRRDVGPKDTRREAAKVRTTGFRTD